jgi:hypothetical protein
MRVEGVVGLGGPRRSHKPDIALEVGRTCANMSTIRPSFAVGWGKVGTVAATLGPTDPARRQLPGSWGPPTRRGDNYPAVVASCQGARQGEGEAERDG